jgi:hypothetical protein
MNMLALWHSFAWDITLWEAISLDHQHLCEVIGQHAGRHKASNTGANDYSLMVIG